MKTLPIALTALALSLGATSLQAADLKYVVVDDQSEYNTLTWINQYYKNPQPELVARRVQILSRMGYFNEPAQAAQAMGFFSQVFAQHPDQVRGWFVSFRNLPQNEQRLLLGALWLSGDRSATRMISEFAQRSGSEAAASLLASSPRAVADISVDSAAAMNLQWGAFVATGEGRHVTSILAAVGSGTQGIAEAARFSLALKASQDERIMQICQAELTRQPKAVQEVLRAALADSKAAVPSS